MSVAARTGLKRMLPRNPREAHRTASTLELFFDLTFVVGVSVAARQLLGSEEQGLATGLVPFLVAFFSIWWPWVNFTWFASAFDTDDWLYRLLTIVQMGGVLVVAAGIPPFMRDGDITIAVSGYVLMRLALVAQWLRASRDPTYRTTALRYAGGVAAVQVGWVLLLLLPPGVGGVGVLLLIVLELAVPPWAERPRVTPFHRHHIAERYGLFTLIVLGEGLLSVTNAVIDAQASLRAGELVLLGATALLLIAAMWWVYFSRKPPVLRTALRGTFVFGYLHYAVFAAAAALASGIELSIAHLEAADGHAARLAPAGVAAATTVPLAVFLLATWLLVLRTSLGRTARWAVPVLAVAAGGAALLPFGLQVAALLAVGTVVMLEVDARRST